MSAVVRWLGRAEYAPVWHGMQDFTDTRGAGTPDEIGSSNMRRYSPRA
jgi:lipoyl(octanoyl) transferase